MWFYTDPVKSFQRTSADAEHETHEAEAVEGFDSPVGANEVFKHSCGLGPRALRHTRQIGHREHTHAIAGTESLSIAISSIPSRPSHVRASNGSALSGRRWRPRLAAKRSCRAAQAAC